MAVSIHRVGTLHLLFHQSLTNQARQGLLSLLQTRGVSDVFKVTLYPWGSWERDHQAALQIHAADIEPVSSSHTGAYLGLGAGFYAF